MAVVSGQVTSLGPCRPSCPAYRPPIPAIIFQTFSMRKLVVILCLSFAALFTAAAAAKIKIVGNGNCTDIGGGWKALYHDYGRAKSKDVVTIVVDGTKFSGTKRIGDDGVGAGQKTIEGRIEAGNLSEVYVFSGYGGAGTDKHPPNEIAIENDCNKLSFYFNQSKILFTR